MSDVRLIQVIRAIREITDGRRHYDGNELFDALGDIRNLCDKALLGPKIKETDTRMTVRPTRLPWPGEVPLPWPGEVPNGHFDKVYTVNPLVPSTVPLIEFERIVAGAFSITKEREYELTQLVIDSAKEAPIVFDLSRTEVLVANWARFLAHLVEKARRLGGHVVFIGMSETIKIVFDTVAKHTKLFHASSFLDVGRAVLAADAANDTSEPEECPCCGKGFFSTRCNGCEYDDTKVNYEFSRSNPPS